MAKASTTITFANGDQITSAKLNQIMSGFQLESDSVDGTTITLSGGQLILGTVPAGNLGANSVTTVKVLNRNITGEKIALATVAAENIVLLTITGSLVAEETLGWTKTLTADRAVQADMQSESGSHFVSPDVLKYHPGVAKAYGTVSFENGVTTITGGYNITSATDGGSTRVVTMAITMANTNYVVTCTGNGGGSQFNVIAKTTTTFTLEGPAEAASRSCSFVVFGQRA